MCDIWKIILGNKISVMVIIAATICLDMNRGCIIFHTDFGQGFFLDFCGSLIRLKMGKQC